MKQTDDKGSINEILEFLTKTLTFVDTNADAMHTMNITMLSALFFHNTYFIAFYLIKSIT